MIQNIGLHMKGRSGP